MCVSPLSSPSTASTFLLTMMFLFLFTAFGHHGWGKLKLAHSGASGKTSATRRADHGISLYSVLTAGLYNQSTTMKKHQVPAMIPILKPLIPTWRIECYNPLFLYGTLCHTSQKPLSFTCWDEKDFSINQEENQSHLIMND
ncbi:hypothetical protein CC78DRAFT_357778 [Lojkania enalia]|uniref:Uncharacterized protein n=1 Tax=Lojkania enalia TaxID=147567 RepID=A0A9P4K3S4_9PLEO|nr:hypothetical protein CC78DRAFT_357778 [Didymosphaeria enalia]